MDTDSKIQVALPIPCKWWSKDLIPGVTPELMSSLPSS